MASNPKLFYFIEKQQFDEAVNLLSEIEMFCKEISSVHGKFLELIMLSSVYHSPDQVGASLLPHTQIKEKEENSNQ